MNKSRFKKEVAATNVITYLSISMKPALIATLSLAFTIHPTLASSPEATPSESTSTSAQSAYDSAVKLLHGDKESKDPEKALDLFRKANALGHAEAPSAIGYFYTTGLVVEKNDIVAAEWFQKGSDRGSVMAKFNLGRFYLDGKGGLSGREKGIALMEEAASSGSEDAQAALAEIYFMGLYDPEAKPDFAKAIPHVEASQKAGNPSATNMLGVMYREGHAVAVDPKKAETLFREAARKGNFKAQSNLGHLLDPSSKKRSRRIEAVAWLSLAADQGEPLAAYKMNELRVYLPSKEVEEANQLAEKLRAEIVAQ